MQKVQKVFHTHAYCEHKSCCVKCREFHNTKIKDCKEHRNEPQQFHIAFHSNENHSTNYQGCKVYQEHIYHKLKSPLNNHSKPLQQTLDPRNINTATHNVTTHANSYLKLRNILQHTT